MELTNKWFTVKILDTEPWILKRVWKIEDELKNNRIYFDTGYGFAHGDKPGYREWSLDWSYSCPASIDSEGKGRAAAVKLLDDWKIKYELLDVVEQGTYHWKETGDSNDD